MISNDKQLNLHLIGEARKISDLDYDRVSRCSTAHDAIRLCMRQISITEESWATYLGVTQGALHTIITSDIKKSKSGDRKRTRHFPLDWIDMIQRKAGNRAITQFLDLQSKGLLYCQQSTPEQQRIAELQAEIEQLQRVG